jgi:hypothetical protein
MTEERFRKLRSAIEKLGKADEIWEITKLLTGLKQELDSDSFSLIGKSEYQNGQPCADPRPLASQRAVSRLLGRFDIERLAEFMTPNELRVNLESVLLDILQASTEDEQSARYAQTLVREMADVQKLKLGPNSAIYPIAEINSDLKALDTVAKQAAALRERSNLDSSAEPLLQLLLPIYHDVSKNWSTVSRRMRGPAILAFLSAMVAMSLYFLIGMKLPSIVLLGIPIISTITSFGLAYEGQRRRIESDLKERKQSLIGLDPMERGVGPSKRFWKVDDPGAVLNEIIKKVRKRSVDAEEGRLKRTIWETSAFIYSFIAFSVFPCLAIASFPFFARNLPLSLAPKYDVVVARADKSVCVLETGMVIWPGPADIILLRLRDGSPTIVRRSEIISLNQPSSPTLPSCSSDTGKKTQADLKPNTTILELFKESPIGDPPWKASDVSLTDASLEQIQRVKAWVDKCHPIISVQGFASEKAFIHSNFSQQWNYKLAELRRQKVIEALGMSNRLPMAGFNDLEEMQHSRPFKSLSEHMEDATQQMARIAMIKIGDPGDCTN